MKEKRTSLIQIKVTPSEKKVIIKKADKIGLDLSTYIRSKCLTEEK